MSKRNKNPMDNNKVKSYAENGNMENKENKKGKGKEKNMY